MKYSVAAILALGVVPAHSLSYLQSLSGAAAPSISSAAPAPAAEPPFFFTNGARDEPAETPDFFFTNGSSDAPVAATSSSGYLSALGSGANSVSGAGMASYLDSLPKNAAPSVGGAGMASFTDTLSGKASPPPAYEPEPAAPAAPAPVADEPAAPVSSGNYMDTISASSTSGAPTGAGMAAYLDSLPRAASSLGGAGIQSYTDSLPVTNTAVGTGAGMSTYTDNLSGGRTSSGKSYKPFASKSSAPAFGMGTSSGKFDFSIHADADMIAQIKAAGGRRVRLSGRATMD